MLQASFIFILSATVPLILRYILGIIWFGDKRSQMVRSFFILGMITAYWVAFNGMITVTNEKAFPAILSAGMIFVCSLPFALFWFVLHYTKSPLVHKKAVMMIMALLPITDILLMLTTSIHKLYFTDYVHPVPGKGILFWVHLVVCLIVVFLAVIHIMVHAVKTPRYRIHLFCAGLGILLSSVMRVSFAMNPFLSYALPSIGFFLTFLLFVFSAHKSHAFNLRRVSIDQIFFSLDDIFFIFDKEGTITEYNEAARASFPQIFPLAETAALHELIFELSARLLRCKPANLLETIGVGEENCEGELYLITGDGRIKAYALRWHAIAHKSVLGGYTLSLSDTSAYHDMINEINEKNESLTQLTLEALAASKAKSTFLTNMSHEIRTPLNAIIGMSHITKESLENREKAVKSINQILGASKHLLEILNNILDMSKIESGKFMIASEPFSLQTALNEVIDIFTQRCEEKKIMLTANIDKLPGAVVGDALRLKQVLINLLGNAVKFTDTGGQVQLLVSGEEDENGLCLRVGIQDSGIGMSEEQISRLFNAFEQADSSIAARYGGTGIGLALSQHLVGLMGGVITVESQLGHGTTFSFTIHMPIPLRAEGGQQEQAVKILDLQGKRVLVVDDIEVNRIIIAELLAKTNVSIEEAEDGAQALKLFGESPEAYYDLIFMDVQMPNMSGHEATRQIRTMQRKDAALLPIVAMTANAYQEDVEKALHAGMTAHLAKPIEIASMYALLAQLVNS